MRCFMNKKLIYAVKDRLGQDFNYPLFAISDLVALRTILEHPNSFDLQTFELYCLGEFNHDTGVIIALEEPLLVCNLNDAEALYNKLKSEL